MENTKPGEISSELEILYLAFSDDEKHIRFWTNSALRAALWADEWSWELDKYVRLSDAEKIIAEKDSLIERLKYLINKTYYIDEANQLHQVLMDNLLADVAIEVLEDLS